MRLNIILFNFYNNLAYLKRFDTILNTMIHDTLYDSKSLPQITTPTNIDNGVSNIPPQLLDMAHLQINLKISMSAKYKKLQFNIKSMPKSWFNLKNNPYNNFVRLQ
jgi:hypothetical protein